MLIQRTLRTALWKQIAKALKQDILDGILPQGQRIPTESALAGRFGVNRHTMRRALATLQGEGLLRIEQGRGTFVCEHVLDYTVSRRTRFRENLSHQRRVPGGELLTASVVKADATATGFLLVPKGRDLALLEILRQADSRPVSVASHYFPLPRFAGIADIFRRTGSITAALAELGVPDYVRQTTQITSRMPTAREAELLLQPRSKPVTVLTSVNVDLRGVPIDFGVTRYAGDRVQVVVDFSAVAA